MTLTNPMKVVLALVLIALIGLGFWVMDWQKKFAEIKQLDSTLQQKEEQFKKAQQKVADLPKELQRKDELTRTLQSLIREQLSPEPIEVFVPAYITEIEKLVMYETERMRDPSFTVISITPGALLTPGAEAGKAGEAGKEEKGAGEVLKGYPTRTFQMTLKGKYITLIDFLYQLGALKLKRLVTIDKITLAPMETKPGESPILSIIMPVTAYLWQGGGPR